jgi:hypothetical protein
MVSGPSDYLEENPVISDGALAKLCHSKLQALFPTFPTKDFRASKITGQFKEIV